MSPRPIKGDGAMEVRPLASRSARWDIFWGSKCTMIGQNLEIKLPRPWGGEGGGEGGNGDGLTINTDHSSLTL